jgi:hypothetical protein
LLSSHFNFVISNISAITGTEDFIKEKLRSNMLFLPPITERFKKETETMGYEEKICTLIPSLENAYYSSLLC